MLYIFRSRGGRPEVKKMDKTLKAMKYLALAESITYRLAAALMLYKLCLLAAGK